MVEQKKSLAGKAPEARRPGIEAEGVPQKRRRHGYRGYPMSKVGGGVHFARGFSGVEPLGGGEAALPKANILTEHTTRKPGA